MFWTETAQIQLRFVKVLSYLININAFLIKFIPRPDYCSSAILSIIILEPYTIIVSQQLYTHLLRMDSMVVFQHAVLII